jgi:hypothetical protein
MRIDPLQALRYEERSRGLRASRLPLATSFSRSAARLPRCGYKTTPAATTARSCAEQTRLLLSSRLCTFTLRDKGWLRTTRQAFCSAMQRTAPLRDDQL